MFTAKNSAWFCNHSWDSFFNTLHFFKVHRSRVRNQVDVFPHARFKSILFGKCEAEHPQSSWVVSLGRLCKQNEGNLQRKRGRKNASYLLNYSFAPDKTFRFGYYRKRGDPRLSCKDDTGCCLLQLVGYRYEYLKISESIWILLKERTLTLDWIFVWKGLFRCKVSRRNERHLLIKTVHLYNHPLFYVTWTELF